MRRAAMVRIEGIRPLAETRIGTTKDTAEQEGESLELAGRVPNARLTMSDIREGRWPVKVTRDDKYFCSEPMKSQIVR